MSPGNRGDSGEPNREATVGATTTDLGAPRDVPSDGTAPPGWRGVRPERHTTVRHFLFRSAVADRPTVSTVGIRRRLRAAAALLAGAVVGLACRPGPSQQPNPAVPAAAAPRMLIAVDEFPKGWFWHSAENGSPLADVWRVEKSADGADPVLICKGKPFGYLRSVEQYDDFDFGFEWKFPTDPDGNSGVLVNTNGEDRIWPQSVQVQLHRPTTGSIFPIGGAVTANRVDTKEMELPINTWHTCSLSSRGGTISVTVNGAKVGEVTGCVPKKGTIGLQSEGAEIHFRKMWIRRAKVE